MQLIECPACANKVSPAAYSCPRCGHPLQPSGSSVSERLRSGTSPSVEKTLWQARPSMLGVFPSLIGPSMFSLFSWIVLVNKSFIVRMVGVFWKESNIYLDQYSDIIDLTLLGACTASGVVALWRIFVSLWRQKSTTYTLTNQRFIAETGIISKHLEEIDLRYVNDTSFQQSIAGRLFGIGTVLLISKDATSPTQYLHDISSPRKARERIRSAAYEASKGQVFMREA